jgi:hypothetical protein
MAKTVTAAKAEQALVYVLLLTLLKTEIKE